jgi:hypothetical protein
MNPISAVIVLVFALAATWAPWRRPGDRGSGLWIEALALVVTVVAALQLARLAVPTRTGLAWGRVALYAAAYWYACVGGMALVRMVLDLVPVSAQPVKGGIAVSATEMARGRMIGGALALTLVLLGQYGALGLLIAAKALARFRALEERDFAEYFLIGTLTSLLLALLVGVGVRLLT